MPMASQKSRARQRSRIALAKFLLYLFNLLFWILGVSVMITGSVIEVRYSVYVSFLGDASMAAPITLIIVGAAIAVVGFFGCCGILRENYCMTMTFAGLLVAIFIVEVCAGVASYLLRDNVEEIMQGRAIVRMEFYNQTGEDALTSSWNKVQADFGCCGVIGPTDWNNTKIYRENMDLPDSCCIRPRQGCGRNLRMAKTIIRFGDGHRLDDRLYVVGCLEKLSAWLNENGSIFAVIALCIILFQIIGISLSCYLSYGLRLRIDYYN